MHHSDLNVHVLSESEIVTMLLYSEEEAVHHALLCLSLGHSQALSSYHLLIG